MSETPVSWCISTGHRFRRIADESSDTAIKVLAKHLDLPMDDAETVSFVREAMRSAYAEISEAYHMERVNSAKAYSQGAGHVE